MRYVGLVFPSAFLALGLASHVQAQAETVERAGVMREPGERFYDARAAQEERGYWIRNIGQLGGGIWATDTTYDDKIRNALYGMGGG